MGLDDVLANRKKKATKIKIQNLEQLTASIDKSKNVETSSRPIKTTTEKATGWLTNKKKDEDWISEPSDNEDEDDFPTLGGSTNTNLKPQQDFDDNSHEDSYGNGASKESQQKNVWAASKAAEPEPEIVEKPAGPPAAFVPSALRVGGAKPKVDNPMEFPTLDVAAKEEIVKPRQEPTHDPSESNWQTASSAYRTPRAQMDDYNTPPGGRFQPRSRREAPNGNAAAAVEDVGWSRGHGQPQQQQQQRESYPSSRDNYPDASSSGFVRRGQTQPFPSRSNDGPPLQRSYEPPSQRGVYEPPSQRSNADNNAMTGSWKRGQVMETVASLSPMELQEQARSREAEMRNKNRFAALSDLS